MPISPDTGNFTVGKGILSIAAWVGDTPPASYTDVGNATSIEVEHAVEKLPHYSSRQSYKLKDKNITIQRDYTVTFILDEIAVANLAMFILGTTATGVIHALQSADAEWALQFVSDNPTGPNRTYTFWKASIMPSGPMALIGEEWMQLSYISEGLADVANHPSSPYYDITYTTTTTTTSTTSSTTSSTTTTTA